MNYAALIALLAVMAFTFPFAVRLAERIGIPRSYGIVVSIALAIFFSTWAYIRWRLDHPLEQAPEGLESLPHEPYKPERFYQKGVFQGELLRAQGKRQEALKVYRSYRDILAGQGRDTDEVDRIILELEGEA